jgi:hypothetical protein
VLRIANMTTEGRWSSALEKARKLVANMTLEEKVCRGGAEVTLLDDTDRNA